MNKVLDNPEIKKYQENMMLEGRCDQCICPWNDGICECHKWDSESERIKDLEWELSKEASLEISKKLYMKKPLQAILIASEQMRNDTKSGKKKITIREGHRSYENGPVLIGCHILDWAVMREIVSVIHTTLGKVDKKDLMDDYGSDSCENAIKILSQWYPKINADSEVTVIRWK